MSYDLRQLFEVAGEVREIDDQLELSEYELFGTKPFIRPVRIRGKVTNRAGVVTLRYRAEFVLRLFCDRCLDEFERSYQLAFEHLLTTRLMNTDNDEYLVLEDGLLDLEQLALDDILLSLPTKLLCREDCKGLCEHCGQNLNHGSCGCSEEAEATANKTVDPRLAALGELLK